jgi:lipoprotein-anchoring transpeptidase ErfK/SrfK
MFSGVLKSYDGGDGEVALHGMHGPLLATPGTAVSHGCVRLTAALDRLLSRIPLGTPVEIRS